MTKRTEATGEGTAGGKWSRVPGAVCCASGPTAALQALLGDADVPVSQLGTPGSSASSP